MAVPYGLLADKYAFFIPAKLHDHLLQLSFSFIFDLIILEEFI